MPIEAYAIINNETDEMRLFLGKSIQQMKNDDGEF